MIGVIILLALISVIEFALICYFRCMALETEEAYDKLVARMIAVAQSPEILIGPDVRKRILMALPEPVDNP
jgi:hypothetical protein